MGGLVEIRKAPRIRRSMRLRRGERDLWVEATPVPGAKPYQPLGPMYDPPPQPEPKRSSTGTRAGVAATALVGTAAGVAAARQAAKRQAAKRARAKAGTRRALTGAAVAGAGTGAGALYVSRRRD